MLLHQTDSAAPVHRRILVVAWFGWTAVFFALISFFQLSLLYRTELGLDDNGVKAIKSLALAMTGVGGLSLGLAADRFGRKRAMIFSIVIYALATACASLAHSLQALEACAAIAGIGIGGQWAAGQTLLCETVPSRLRGQFGALAQTGAPIGIGLATLLATQIAPATGWRAAFLIAATPIVLAGVIAVAVPESDVWLEHRANPKAGRSSSLATLFGPGVRGVFAIAFVLTLFNMTNYRLTTSWLPEFLGRAWGLTIQKSGAWTLVFVAGSVSGYLLYGLASDRWGRRRMFTLFSVIMAIGLAMITLTQDRIRTRPENILLALFVTGLGTGTWSGFGPLFTELFPTSARNTAAGVCMNVSRSAQFVAPLLVVAVGGAALGGGIALAVVFALLAGAWVWLLPETRGRSIA